MTGVTLHNGLPRSIVTFVTVNNRLPCSIVQVILLQRGYCTFVTIIFLLGCSSTWRCAQDHFFQKSATTHGLVEQALWRVPLFTEWIGASSFEAILAGPSRHSTTWAFSSGTSGFRRFLFILLHERIWRRVRLCLFCTFINIMTETTIVSFRTLPVAFPLPTISKNSLSTLFCPLILDHGVLLIISSSGFKNSSFVNLARYFFLPSS